MRCVDIGNVGPADMAIVAYYDVEGRLYSMDYECYGEHAEWMRKFVSDSDKTGVVEMHDKYDEDVFSSRVLVR